MTNQPNEAQLPHPPRELTLKQRQHSFQNTEHIHKLFSTPSGLSGPDLSQSETIETYTKAECMRCVDDVIPAGSVASTASSSGGLSHELRRACWATTVLERCVPSV